MNFKSIHKISCLTIIHGTDDEVVGFVNGKTLFDSWLKKHPQTQMYETKQVCGKMDLVRCEQARFFIIHHAGHNDIDTSYEK